MPFYSFDKERLAAQVRQLGALRYRDALEIPAFNAYEDDGKPGRREPAPGASAFPMRIGDTWKGYDRYLWLCAAVEIPESFAGHTIAGLFDFGETDFGNIGKFEGLLYIDDTPVQGVDQNHQEVLFTHAAGPARLRFRLWSGLVGGGEPFELTHKLSAARLALLDGPTDTLYHLSRNALGTYDVLPDNSPEKPRLLNALVRAFELLDFSAPVGETFYRSAYAACGKLEELLGNAPHSGVTVALTGHTHIDVAWLWRYRHTREKCARSFSTALHLMELYGGYVQLQSTPQLYEYIRQDYPDIYARIAERIREGRWEPEGAMWVECDCNLAGGEAIVRQLLYGTRFFEKEFGKKSTFLWLPDVFGYTWAMPQLLRRCGIDTFVTTKISWNDHNRMPYDTFLWRGMDGSEVLAHFITTPETYTRDYYSYNGELSPAIVQGVWDNYASKDLNTDLMIAYGFGDGGGGVNRDMLETAECLNRMPGLPEVRHERAGDYLRRLNETVRQNPRGAYLPVWDGELYLEFHRGTYTSQARVKRENRRMEYLARKTEIASSLATAAAGMDYPAEELTEAWKTILRNQFHDVLPGSSIAEVYEDTFAEYSEARTHLKKALEQAGSALCQPSQDCYTVVGTSIHSCSTLARLPVWKPDCHFEDAAGNILPATPEGEAAQVLVELPSMAQAAVFLRHGAGQAPVINAKTSDGLAETDFYRIRWNNKGHLTEIYDKLAGRELLTLGGCGNVLQVFEDKPRDFDAWELESTFERKMETVEDLLGCEILPSTPISQDIVFSWRYRSSTIRQRMRLYAHTRRIDFETLVDWQEREKFMKVAFPVDIRATKARYDIQFGSIERPATRNNGWEAAKFEVVGHRWADLSETGYGVALLNDCKYGYDIKNGVLRLSLIKSAIYPDPQADRGKHTFTYALYPHTQPWECCGLEEAAEDINDSPMVFPGTPRFEGSLLTVDSPLVSLDALKKAEDEDALLIRLHERCGARGKVCVSWKLPVTGWRECSPLEEPLEGWRDSPMEFNIRPFEIRSFLLRL